jgi:leucyl aminopeptidase (aminopeptidase T)
VIVAIGSNVGLPGGIGGKNAARSHADLTTLRASFFIDDEQIIDRGRFVVKDLEAGG